MNRASLPKDLEMGLNAHFGHAYRELPEEWRPCFQIERSEKAFEEDVLMTGFGAAQVKAEGDAVAQDDLMQGWSARYTHETIALSSRITEEAVEDNLYFSLGPRIARALARSMKHTKEIKGAAVFNNATSSSHLGGDGVPLLSTAHPMLNGGTFSNKLATPADMSEASLEDISIQIRKAKDDRGLHIGLMPTMLVIPPDIEFDTCRILKSSLRPGTSDNDTNALRAKGLYRDPHVLTRLTDPDAWFVTTDAPDGLKYFQRIGIQRGMEGEFETGDLRYKCRERYIFGHSDPRGVYGSEGAA
jgi:hypothetical protein